jgi:hypothetical protein
LCDRKTGECECFDGYEGAGCRRTVCANDCSGHGTCESVNALTTGSYLLWDGDKSMSCKCDPGYGAADCSERQCPKGDDPLTTNTGESTTTAKYPQRNENVYFDVYSNTDATAGYVQLQYEDDFGETWWSNYIGPLDDYADLSTQAEKDAQAKLVSDAFTSIPNSVFESVDVTPADVTGYTYGISFAVNFTSNPGNLNDITCLTADRFSNTEKALTASDCVIVSSGTLGATGSITDDTTALTTDADYSAYVGVGDRLTVGSQIFTIEAISGASITTTSKSVGDETASTVKLNLDGTTESAECSNRGLCDYETGTCVCFQGYTGDDCGTQSTLAW